MQKPLRPQRICRLSEARLVDSLLSGLSYKYKVIIALT